MDPCTCDNCVENRAVGLKNPCLYRLDKIPDVKIQSKIMVQGECWIWVGSLNDNGYGHFVRGVKGRKPGEPRQKKSYVHRYTYELFKGKIPKKEEVHHKCYNRDCCFPGHLFALTHALNVALNTQISF